MTKNTVKYHYKVRREERNLLNGHGSFLIFFTGLSGSGKSTIANALEQFLYEKGVHTYVLDGDNIRRGINRNLGFSQEDRSENNRIVGEISKLFVDAGVVVMAAFVAPYKRDREFIKQTVNPSNFFEVFVNTCLSECERRDVKGLYKLARKGKIRNMTGISDAYEIPDSPDVEITELNSVEESVELIYQKIMNKLVINE